MTSTQFIKNHGIELICASCVDWFAMVEGGRIKLKNDYYPLCIGCLEMIRGTVQTDQYLGSLKKVFDARYE